MYAFPLRNLAPIQRWGARIFLVLVALFSLQTEAETPPILPAQKAFLLDSEIRGQQLHLTWTIHNCCYLYHDRFHFQAEGVQLGQARFDSPGEAKEDPEFGTVYVHHQHVEVDLPIIGKGAVKVSWQGCNQDAGICYPPQNRVIEIQDSSISNQPLPDQGQAIHPLTKLLPFYVGGLGVAFTPCLLPMLPILSGIIARQHRRHPLDGLMLSSSYVIGMGTTYAIIGGLFAWLGHSVNIAAWFQEPWVLLLFALLFICLALSLFGLFEIRLPSRLHNTFDALSRRPQGGSLAGSYLIGLFSALVVSPCVSAPLAGAIVYITTLGNIPWGALLLFVLALGMGTPLILLGTTEGKLLPKAGPWMHAVKAVFGVGMLIVALQLLARILPGPLTLALWAVLAAVCAVYMGALEPRPQGWERLWKGMGVVLLTTSVIWLIGAASGADDPLHPLGKLRSSAAIENTAPIVTVRSPEELSHALELAKEEGHQAMVDFYADWCISCQQMEHSTFTAPEVVSRLRHMAWIKADVTDNTRQTRALLEMFQIPGPPALIFYDPKGQEITSSRIAGEIGAADFLNHLQRFKLGD